jgi:predicted O-methyltransferase YrrM
VLRIQEDIHKRGKYPMQISLEQVVFHAWLCRLIGARQVLEVGTYLGLSAAGFALAIGEQGHVDTVELETEHADIAEAWFRQGGIAGRIAVHRGQALDVVPRLRGPYDLCFLDGAKRDNQTLMELCIERTRAGGLILVDNAFSNGAIVDPGESEDLLGTRQALDFARASKALDPVLLPVADGLLVCRRL